ncbi:MAG: DegV family protein [Chloroflexota bacterium]
MSGVRIVTDSTANLPDDLVASNRIDVVPLRVLFGNDAYRDGIDLTPDEFYKRLREAPALPHTSQPSAGEFKAVYERLLAEQAAIVSIHISGKLSGTVASAQAAQGMLPGADLTVVDTLSASMGLGLIVLRAAVAAREGRSPAEIVALVERLRHQVHLYFVVDTLEYLHKGGRIGGATALLGSLLNVKPILTLRDGQVEPLERVRTKARAIERLIGLVGEEVESGGSLRIAVLHGNAPGEAQALAEQIRGRFHPATLMSGEVGPTIATHTGPGVVGAAFYVEK